MFDSTQERPRVISIFEVIPLINTPVAFHKNLELFIDGQSIVRDLLCSSWVSLQSATNCELANNWKHSYVNVIKDSKSNANISSFQVDGDEFFCDNCANAQDAKILIFVVCDKNSRIVYAGSRCTQCHSSDFPPEAAMRALKASMEKPHSSSTSITNHI